MPVSSFQLETLTPLFLHGPDPRGPAELRPPAVRGALRYWLRALLGGTLGDTGPALTRVRQSEARVFGRADSEASRGSATSVRVRVSGRPAQKTFQPAKAPTGQDYLYWSMGPLNQLKGSFYLPGRTPFEVQLTTRANAEEAGQAHDLALAAFWLLVHLGGLGARSRRTAGSIATRDTATATTALPLRLEGEDLPAMATHVSTQLQQIRDKLITGNPAVAGAFDVIHPSFCSIWLLGSWEKEDGAVEAIGSGLRAYRETLAPPRAEIERWLGGGKAPDWQAAIFGLPIPVRYAKPNDLSFVLGPNGIARRASPLWLSLTRSSRGEIVGVATLFRSQFLPDGTQLKAGIRPQTKFDPRIDYAVIDRFIADTFPQAEEVPYA